MPSVGAAIATVLLPRRRSRARDSPATSRVVASSYPYFHSYIPRKKSIRCVRPSETFRRSLSLISDTIHCIVKNAYHAGGGAIKHPKNSGIPPSKFEQKPDCVTGLAAAQLVSCKSITIQISRILYSDVTSLIFLEIQSSTFDGWNTPIGNC